MKRFRILLSLLLVGLLCLALPACSKKAKLPEMVASVLNVKINPEINIFLNAEGEVLSIQPVNADGMQVLDAIDGNWGDGTLSDIVRKIAETSISEGFLAENGEIALQFYGDAEELPDVQSAVDAALEQVRQEASVPFTVTDPEARPVNKYRGEAPVYNYWDAYPWDTEVRNENGILISAEMTEPNGLQRSLRYDEARSETTITQLLPNDISFIEIYYSDGQKKSEEVWLATGDHYAYSYYPDGSTRSYINYVDNYRCDHWPNGNLKLESSTDQDGVRYEYYHREDGTRQKTQVTCPDGTYQIDDFYEDGETRQRSEILNADGFYIEETFYRNGNRKTYDASGSDGSVSHEEFNEAGQRIKILTTDSATGYYALDEYYSSGVLKYRERRDGESYCQIEEYNEAGQPIKILSNDSATGSYSLEEYYSSGARKYSELRDGEFYTLEERFEDGTVWHQVIEQPGGYKNSFIKDEQGNIIKEESVDPGVTSYLYEILEDGRIHEYYTEAASNSIYETYGVLDENGEMSYTYIYRKTEDRWSVHEYLEDGSFRLEDHISDDNYSIYLTYPDRMLKHHESFYRYPENPDNGCYGFTDFLPDGSVCYLDTTYFGATGSMRYIKECYDAGGWHEEHIDQNGVLRYVLDMQADGSWNSVLTEEHYTETMDFVAGQYFRRYREFNSNSYMLEFYDVSGHLELAWVYDGVRENPDDIAYNYDGPASVVYGSISLDDFSDRYKSDAISTEPGYVLD